MRFLVVDDHPLMADAIRTALLGLERVSEVVCVATLGAALEASANEAALDLVLLDLALPDCSGPQALQRFREQRAQLPVVVVSGTNDADAIVAALEMGAMGFIPKTSPRDVLLNAVRLVASGGIYVPVEALRARAPRSAEADALITPLPPGPPGHASRAGITPTDLGLTARQAQVLAFVLKGMPNKLVARKLDISENTVKVHLSAVFQALNVNSRTQALVAATRLGLRLDADAKAKSTPGRDAR
ncbi:MAG TPA: response regulator transcription factor [Burkholderiaceae bacterium]|nr:response regulator transcription factor [Burkholderiaceae bacterium]